MTTASRRLRAGPLQLEFVPEEGAIRYLAVGATEVLRGISAPVRDHVWATIPGTVSDVTIDDHGDGFTAGFTMRCRGGAVDFRWRGELVGRRDGTLTFTFAGEALSDFARNRIGFCVLHPAALAGARCVVEHVDRSFENGRFPLEISPDQPFRDIRALTHAVGDGVECEVRFEGDTFEAEDQRNWTDASFKTYCTPLALPYPVAVKAHTFVRQKVTVRIRGAATGGRGEFRPPWVSPTSVTVDVGAPIGMRVPALGCLWTGSQADPAAVAAVRGVGLAHLRVPLRLDERFDATAWVGACAVAAVADCALEVALFMAPSARVPEAFGAALADKPRGRLARWLVYAAAGGATPARGVAAVRAAVAGTPAAAPVGGGATEDFAELNRAAETALAGDFTVHGCSPQVHARDEATVVETLPIQGATAATARIRSGGKPVVLSPVTFTRRWRAGEPGCPPLPPGDALLPFQPDERAAGAFGAVWLFAAVAEAARAGVAAITAFESHGPNGFFAPNGDERPSARVAQCLARLQGAPVARAAVSAPDQVSALAVLTGQGTRLWLANLQPRPQRVDVRAGGVARTLILPPYGWEECAV